MQMKVFSNPESTTRCFTFLVQSLFERIKINTLLSAFLLLTKVLIAMLFCLKTIKFQFGSSKFMCVHVKA